MVDMEQLTIAALSLYAIIFIALAILLPAAIIFNFNVGKKPRQKLAQQLDQLRISKMIKALGIDATQYLHKEHIHTINTQMARCSECGNTARCDDELDSGKVNITNIAYCNNEVALKDIIIRQEQAQ